MDLLRKRIEGRLTKQEESAFREWLKESKENQQLFEQFQLLKQEGKDYTFYNNINTDIAWNKILKKAKNNSRSKPLTFLRNPMRMAAAIAALLIGIFAINNLLNNPNVTDVEFGQPGSFQAYLNVNDQREIKVLPETKSFDRVSDEILSNLQGELRYDLLVENDSPAEKHTLKVPRGGEYKLVLEDGSRVWVNADSKLSYPSKFDAKERKVILEGEAYFDVAKDIDKPFIVSTDKMDITVLGTSFNVSAYPGKLVHSTTLVEGIVNVEEHAGHARTLKPGEQLSLFLDKAESRIAQVDTKVATDWIDGKYIFKNEDLERIMDQLSKWYALNYEFVSSNLKNVKYTGIAYKHRPLVEFLDAISFTRPIEFRIENDKLLIIEK